MPKLDPKVVQEKVDAHVREQLGSQQLKLWQLEAYVSILDKFVSELPPDEPVVNKKEE